MCFNYVEIRQCILGFILIMFRHMSTQNQLIYIMQNRQKDLITYLKEAWDDPHSAAKLNYNMLTIEHTKLLHVD